MHELSRHAHQVFRKKIDGTEVVLWMSVCAEGGIYACLFNIGEEKCTYSIKDTDIEMYDELTGIDIMSKEPVSFKGELKVSLAKHAAKAYYLA